MPQKSCVTKKTSSTSNSLPNGTLETTFQVQLNATVENVLPQGRSQQSRNRQPVASTTCSEPQIINENNVLSDEACPSQQLNLEDKTVARETAICPNVEVDAIDKPFLEREPTHFSSMHSNQSAESFDFGNVSDSFEGNSPHNSGSATGQNCLPACQLNSQDHVQGSLRTGQHSTHQHCNCPPKHLRKKGADDIRPFFQEVDYGDKTRQECVLCQKAHAIDKKKEIKDYSLSTSTSGLHLHLIDKYADEWIHMCKQSDIPIMALPALSVLEDYHKYHGQGEMPDLSCNEFIVKNDQLLNVIENEHLQAIFLMLQRELKDSDIPHCTHICEKIMEKWQEHMKTLSNKMQELLGKISLTTDLWTDQNLSPFMAVTAHWIQEAFVPTANGGKKQVLRLHSDFIGFHCVPGHHTGVHLVQHPPSTSTGSPPASMSAYQSHPPPPPLTSMGPAPTTFYISISITPAPTTFNINKVTTCPYCLQCQHTNHTCLHRHQYQQDLPLPSSMSAY
ncbi:hypothetical protein BDQ12DRAFT_725383 [Crucibulum laeve]|uniref:Uncharacterized protein n=1 Tax=Crucibulum laeve TaxID=68775 RepID=A0A5C3LTH3_9AGAR|nr:hypothetical protein BDQ12DRAFT_725383 [Crucibulum laeve]